MEPKKNISAVVQSEIYKEICRLSEESGRTKSYILNKILIKFFKKRLNIKEAKDVRF